MEKIKIENFKKNMKKVLTKKTITLLLIIFFVLLGIIILGINNAKIGYVLFEKISPTLSEPKLLVSEIDKDILKTRKGLSEYYGFYQKNIPENNDPKDPTYSGYIEVYDTNDEASLRMKVIEYEDNLFADSFNEKNYGEYLYNIVTKNNLYENYNCGRTILRISTSLFPKNEINYMKDEFCKKAPDGYMINKDENYFKEEFTNIKKIVEEDFKERKEKINETLITFSKVLDDELAKIDDNVDEDKLKEIEELFNIFNVDLFKDRVEGWEKKINIIKEKIKENEFKKLQEFKNSCVKYNYSEISRNPSSYLNKPAFFQGKVVQVINNSDNTVSLRVNITKKVFQYIDPLWEDTIYVTYLNYDNSKNRILEDDIVNMWGSLDGIKTYTTVLGSETSIPKFIAKDIEFVN